MDQTKFINVYGCSWSYGLYNIDNKKSWPYYLSCLLPKNYIVCNFAMLGSSLDYSIYQLQQNQQNADINIFQITSTTRFTTWDISTFKKDKMKKITENYQEFVTVNNKNLYDFYTVTGIERETDKKKKNWFYKYVELGMDKGETLRATRISHLYYALNNSDYCFGHIKDDSLKYLGIEYTAQKFNIDDYSEDNGMHFGEEGNKLVASYIYDKIAYKINKRLEHVD